MLRYFPALRPDELFYSACARYRSRLNFRSHRHVMATIFGATSVTAVVDLPCRLAAFEAQVPGRKDLEADHLIHNHTLFPLYAAWMPSARAMQIRIAMKAHGGRSVHLRAGIMAGAAATPSFLRFCPQCDAENMRKFGHTFWQRLHQIPGVLVCSKHACFLVDSDAKRQHRLKRHAFVDPDEAAKPSPKIMTIDTNSVEDRALMNIAAGAEWLLAPGTMSSRRRHWHVRYRELLSERGFATCNGRVDLKRLRQGFQQRYSQTLLERLHCDRRGKWIDELVHRPLTTHSPVHHLLLIEFLGIDVERFFNGEKSTLFGAAPYPCLNTACSDHTLPVVGPPVIEHNADHRCPVGIFTCPTCGYAYARLGPDVAGKRRTNAAFVHNYGWLWYKALRADWLNPTLSLRSIARKLAVDPTTIKRHADKLNLPFPRVGPRPTLRGRAIYIRRPPRRRICRTTRRAAWCAAQRKHPTFGIKMLRLLDPAAYAWLYRHDRTWLRCHSPERVDRHTVPDTNWAARDVLIASKVADAAAQLRQQPTAPIRVSVAALERTLEIRPYLSRHLSKLPLTASAVADVLESREQFALRRIANALRKLRMDELPMRRWRLVRAAGLRAELLANHCVLRALVEAENDLVAGAE